MRIVAFTGPAGAGKDTAALMGYGQKIAFANALYAEVCEAFGVFAEELQHRSTKETPAQHLSLAHCSNYDFVDFKHAGGSGFLEFFTAARSPRQILQWWGDFRRARNPHYFINAVREHIENCSTIGHHEFAISDCRFQNEADMVRELGGQIWQIVRPGFAAGGTGHASDVDGSAFAPDAVIYNDGDMQHLRNQVLSAWHKFTEAALA